MFQPWRIKLREATEALRAGRLDDAGRLLVHGELTQFLPAKQLSAQVAERLVERGQSRAALGDTSAGWHDLQVAARLGIDSGKSAKLRQQLIDHGLAETRRYLAAGDTAAALARLDTLEQRDVANDAVRILRQLVRHLDEAQKLCRRGEFARAEAELETAVALEPGLQIFQQRLQSCRASKIEARDLTHRLHESLRMQRWSDVLSAADSLLELAPDNAVARDAQRRAWREAGTEVRQTQFPTVPKNHNGHRAKMGARTGAQPVEVQSAMKRRPDERFLLWVDGVGGYLVCLGDEIVFGPPAPGSGVDVPILADLSRRHATIRRQGETYLLCPGREVRLDGKALTEPTSLVDGGLIELGSSVQIRFRKPHPLSTTARLEFVSRHRAQPSVDGVILMAQSCIMGPKERNHVVCRDWTSDVVLYRQGDELHCRGKGPFKIDDVLHSESGELNYRSQVAGDDFSFSLEAVA